MTEELKQVTVVRQALQDLRQQLQAGTIYQSLGSRVAHVLAAAPHNDATPVTLPDDEDGIRALVATLNRELQSGTLDSVTDEQLLMLLGHLGSTDLTVRDQGVYYFLNDAVQQHVLTADQMRLVMNALLQDKVLFDHITEPTNDGIYGRSFAMMVLSLFVYVDRVGTAFMTPEMMDRLVDQVLTYIALEDDTRGFVGTTGWAHAYTHIGNMLDELAESQLLSRADKLLMMVVLLRKYRRLGTPLIAGENRRLAAYFATLLNMNDLYTQAFLQEWHQWRAVLSNQPQPNEEAGWNKLFNRSRLATAMLLRDDYPEAITAALEVERDFMS
ncbi:DUF2785 domain-containing protein [Furfurilactobacillus entadae]|uniref:DUF2785 domain-containing protein n=1 Tax=Furfurilactobacillus entadae TaxID=2922307 RepID=UPI0035EF7B95